MSEKPRSLWAALKAKGRELWAEIKAITREAVKDVRQTGHEVYFGKGEHAPELGTPLNPTPQIVTRDLEHGKKYEQYLDGRIQAAIDRMQGRGQERGIER